MSLSLASKTSGTGTQGDVTVNKPSGLAEGDMMVAFINSCTGGGSDQTHSGPSGWTKLENVVPENGSVLTVWAIKATSTEVNASNFSWTSSGDNEETIGVIFRITSTEGFATISDTVVSVAAASLSGDGVTTVTSTNILLLAGTDEEIDGNDANFSNYSVTNNDPTWTEEADIHNDTGGGLGANMGIGSADYNLKQATGTYSVSSDRTGNQSSALVAVGEPENASVTGTTGTIQLSPNTGSASGSANATGSTGTVQLSGQTGSAATPAKKWDNTEKSSAPSWSNTPKS